jgi:hypothetical protein
MKDTLKTLVDVRSCAGRHPWIATGSAAAAGIVAGAMLTPSRHKCNPSKRETASRNQPESSRTGREEESPHKAKSFLSSISGAALAAALPALIESWLTPAAATNGQPPGDTPSSHDSADAITGDNCNRPKSGICPHDYSI